MSFPIRISYEMPTRCGFRRNIFPIPLFIASFLHWGKVHNCATSAAKAHAAAQNNWSNLSETSRKTICTFFIMLHLAENVFADNSSDCSISDSRSLGQGMQRCAQLRPIVSNSVVFFIHSRVPRDIRKYAS